jgi:SAM-dependent methyltransferase
MGKDYADKLRRERQWYARPGAQARHLLNSRLFYSPERNAFNYIFPRQQLAVLIGQVAHPERLKAPRLLIAPIGTGGDIPYLRPLAGLTATITGIDISQEALDRIPDRDIQTYACDMKNMTMFADSSFDVVVVPLFFHHFVRFGFDDFLRELCRVLRPGGFLFSMEPNSLYPIHWVTACARRIFGNISGTVEDEGPFPPRRLSKAMARCGFRDVQVYGASFSYHRMPIPISRINNQLTRPLLRLPLVKYFAWMCLFSGRKA